MGDEQRNLEIVRQLVTLWNEGDIDAFLALYSDDIEMITDPEWPDPDVHGKEALTRYADEWRSAWEELKLNVDPIEAKGDEVRTRGWWDSRGAASGLAGELEFGLDFTFRDGLIVRQRWFRPT
jgi:ketosteroid isomerase-like protein